RRTPDAGRGESLVPLTEAARGNCQKPSAQKWIERTSNRGLAPVWCETQHGLWPGRRPVALPFGRGLRLPSPYPRNPAFPSRSHSPAENGFPFQVVGLSDRQRIRLGKDVSPG